MHILCPASLPTINRCFIENINSFSAKSSKEDCDKHSEEVVDLDEDIKEHHCSKDTH